MKSADELPLSFARTTVGAKGGEKSSVKDIAVVVPTLPAASVAVFTREHIAANERACRSRLLRRQPNTGLFRPCPQAPQSECYHW